MRDRELQVLLARIAIDARASGRAAVRAEELPDGCGRAEGMLAELVAECEGDVAGHTFRIAELFAERG